MLRTDLQISTRDQLHLIINEMDYKVGVEVGVEVGEYTEYLLKETNAFIYGVDCWQYVDGYCDIANISNRKHNLNMMEAFERLNPFIEQDRCALVRKFSADFAKEFEDGSLDFAYIDANHSRPGASSDLMAWGPKIREGGMLAGHDFLDGMYLVADQLSEFGVISAVMDYLKDKHYRLYVTTDEIWPTWYIIKEMK